jgi:fumarylacetoacetase
MLNATHDRNRRSWVASANQPGSDFPIQNLPFCMFSRSGEDRRPGIGIGDQVFDISADAVTAGLEPVTQVAIRQCTGGSLNPLMTLSQPQLSALRLRLSDLLTEGSSSATAMQGHLAAQREVAFHLPAEIGGFTDFFTSLHHTERGGRVTRPDSPVPPNFRYMPIAYNSRASSVRISGEEVRRPNGQWRRPDGTVQFGPTEALDFELELGAFVGRGNALGTPIPVGSANDHVFGYCLLNDWSARDIQRWESFPLGPFLSKTLSTTISPFVVTAEAMAPFRAPACPRPHGDPAPLPYLHADRDQREGGIDLVLEAFIATRQMRDKGEQPVRVTTTNFKDMYWTFAQMLAHHTSNGCNLRTGDLIGSGTTSGPTDESRACLSEITAGSRPIAFPNGEQRNWLEDGDTVVFRARASRAGFVSIGFGECAGRVVASDI